MEPSQQLRQYRPGQCDGASRRHESRRIVVFSLLLTPLFTAGCGLHPAENNIARKQAGNTLASIGPITQNEIAAGHIPGAVILVGHAGRVVLRAAYGASSIVPTPQPMRLDAIFDLASLTKVVATTIAVMQLAETGRLSLDAPVALYWPAFAAHGKDEITIRQLLTHTSGLRPDLPDSGTWSGESSALARIAAERPLSPPGSEFVYSDLNFIVLGAVVERLSGQSLDGYTQQHIFTPLGMTDTGFNPPPEQLSRVVPTDIEQGTLRWGQVQDPTAYRMGGVAGHAGLFSTADDLARFCEMLLNRGSLDGVQILRPDTVALMTSPITLPGGVQRGLGWDMASPYATGLGTEFSPGSYGHTGYTGTALWIDPAADTFLIILTSRLHPDYQGDARPLRQQVAHVVALVFPPDVASRQ